MKCFILILTIAALSRFNPANALKCYDCNAIFEVCAKKAVLVTCKDGYDACLVSLKPQRISLHPKHLLLGCYSYSIRAHINHKSGPQATKDEILCKADGCNSLQEGNRTLKLNVFLRNNGILPKISLLNNKTNANLQTNTTVANTIETVNPIWDVDVYTDRTTVNNSSDVSPLDNINTEKVFFSTINDYENTTGVNALPDVIPTIASNNYTKGATKGSAHTREASSNGMNSNLMTGLIVFITIMIMISIFLILIDVFYISVKDREEE